MARSWATFSERRKRLLPHPHGGAQLYETMRAHGKISRAEFGPQALEMLEKLGFENGERILASYPFELSGGMQQRIGIAAAMLLRPSVLLADEPTSALDVTNQKQVVEEMALVRKTFGTAIVLVSHNLGSSGLWRTTFWC